MTQDHKCSSKTCTGGPRCTHTALICVNCPAGSINFHTSIDLLYPSNAKILAGRKANRAGTALASMSHIDRTDVAELPQLNCNKEKFTTTLVIQEINSSSDSMILLLQDPWLTNSGQPPFSNHYSLLLPPGNTLRSATYIRKDLRINSRIHANDNQCMLLILIEIADKTVEIINVHAPTDEEGNRFLKTSIHTPTPSYRVTSTSPITCGMRSSQYKQGYTT